MTRSNFFGSQPRFQFIVFLKLTREFRFKHLGPPSIRPHCQKDRTSRRLFLRLPTCAGASQAVKRFLEYLSAR